MNIKKLVLPVQRIDTERHCYVVRYQGDYYKVPQYPFQYNLKKPETLRCINKTPNAYTPALIQDKKTVIEDIYEEDIAYTFNIVNTTRSESGTLDVELKDEYGFKFKYPNAGKKAVMMIGQQVEITIQKIEEDGSLSFFMCEVLEDKEGVSSTSISERDAINFDKLCEENKSAKKHLVDNPNFNGLWKSIIDKYPDKAHFIYELLQNADDAKATKASILLYRDGLIFKHNGSVSFSVTDPEDHSKVGHINSITGIGRSTKNDGISNTIGKFGVGFKAVYSYTSRPEIYDDNFWFAIEDYIVPIKLEHDHPMRESGETLFYFPFKNTNVAYDEIMKKLRSLENPNLFLNNINEINWMNETGNRGHYSKQVRKQYSINGIKCQLITLTNNEDTDDLWLFTRGIIIEDSGKHNISVGYYLTEEGRIDTAGRHKVYCFFPTSEKIDLCCILHAPFLLTDNRQNITESPKNQYMLEKLADLAAAALPILRDEYLAEEKTILDENLYKIVPLEEEWDSDTVDINLFFESYKSIIKKEALLLSRNGVYLNKKDAVIPGRKEIVDIVDKNQLNTLLGPKSTDRDFVEITTANNDIITYLRDEIEINNFDYRDLSCRLSPEFMGRQPIEWVSKFYTSILENAKLLLKSKKPNEINRWEKVTEPTFRKAPIFKNQDGNWIPPYKGEKLDTINIYKPSNVVSPGINTVSPELFQLKSCKALLDYLEIDEPNKYDQIKEALIKYEGKHIDIDDDVILRDFEIFLTFYQNATEDEINTFVEKTSDYPIIVSNKEGEGTNLSKASEVYATTNLLMSYLRGNKTNADLRLFDDTFYSSLIKKYGKESVNSFIIRLGAQTFPKIEQKQVSYTQLTQSQMEVYQQCFYSTRGLSSYDYTLPGIEQAIKNKTITADISKRIWSALCCCHTYSIQFTVKGFYRTDFYKHGQSALISLLTKTKWLFGKDNIARKPSEITINQMLEAGYEYSKEWFGEFNICHDKSDIMALGATQEQQTIQDKGQLVKDYSEDQIREMTLDYERKKAIKEAEESRKKQQKESEIEPSRKKMSDNSMTDLFSEDGKRPEPQQPTSVPKKNVTDNKAIEDIAKKLDEEKKSKIQLEELRQTIPTLTKYSMEWFSSLMRLEFKSTGDDEYQTSSSISISFSEVRKDANSERIYILKNPSRLIPMQLEDIGGLTVNFTFRDKEAFSKSFEVACVRNFSLLVKANQDDAESLSKINWADCTKAEININNIADLEKRLCAAFEQLGLEPKFNLKDNLKENISFVFGPPGTGKTTYLAKEISEILSVEEAKILVLTPTNKACDVLTLKLLDTDEKNYSRVGRFVATAESEIEESGVLKARESDFYKKDSFCLVSTMARLPYDGFDCHDGKGSLRNIDWDYIIIDEASMIPIAHISYAIYQFQSANIIIAGDPLQIAPIAQESEWKDENIYTMTNLLTFDSPKTEPIQFDITYLGTQYRSLPDIGNLFSHYAYSGLLKNYRNDDSGKHLVLDGMDIAKVNFMPFRVDRYDSLYGAKKLNNSNIHIYSALLVVEFAKYLAKQYTTKEPDGKLSIGVICPYAPQAHLINNLILQQKDMPSNVEITTGTIHGFQGDECDIILAVLNPPTGLKGAANSVLINNKHIVNVAISRARDYLFVFMPSSETDGYDKLYELNSLGITAKEHCKGAKVFNSDLIESVIFKQRLFLESHAFVTTHQLANIYTAAQARYEIRIDNNAIDVQIDETL